VGGRAGMAVNEVLLLIQVDQEATSSWVWFSWPTALITRVFHGTQFGKGQNSLEAGELKEGGRRGQRERVYEGYAIES